MKADTWPRHQASVSLKVPFHDCDPLFVVWHGRYLQYFEHARTELFARLHLDVPEIRDLGYRMYVTDARCRYMHPLRYGEQARIKATLVNPSPLIRVAYEVQNLNARRRSARGFTVLATTDQEGKLLAETPTPVLERLTATPLLASSESTLAK